MEGVRMDMARRVIQMNIIFHNSCFDSVNGIQVGIWMSKYLVLPFYPF